MEDWFEAPTLREVISGLAPGVNTGLAPGYQVDPYRCTRCLRGTMSEPSQTSTGKWHQACDHCGRTQALRPNHPLVQETLQQPRTFGDWVAATDSP